MIKYVFRQLLCKHEYVNTNEMWSFFGQEHITRLCVKCGKKIDETLVRGLKEMVIKML